MTNLCHTKVMNDYIELRKKQIDKPANVGDRVKVLLDGKWQDFTLSGIWPLSPHKEYDFQVTLDKDNCDGFIVENVIAEQIIKVPIH